MGLTVKDRRVGESVLVLDIAGSIDVESVPRLRETFEGHLNNGERRFVLNLADVSYIDSSGLGALVWSYTSVRNKSGDVKLLNLTARVKDLLQLTKLLTVFDVYESESRAVGALAGWPGK